MPAIVLLLSDLPQRRVGEQDALLPHLGETDRRLGILAVPVLLYDHALPPPCMRDRAAFLAGRGLALGDGGHGGRLPPPVDRPLPAPPGRSEAGEPAALPAV